MRHLKAGNRLGRTHSHRKAMLSNLATALFEHKKIKTTKAKAKVLRSVAERLITFAKRGDLHARRHVLRTVKDKDIVKSLFEEIAPKFAERNGGYTRIIKLGQRHGDAAEVAIIELVGFETVQKKAAPKGETKAKEKVVEDRKAKEAPVAESEPVEETVENGAEEIPESINAEEKKDSN